MPKRRFGHSGPGVSPFVVSNDRFKGGLGRPSIFLFFRKINGTTYFVLQKIKIPLSCLRKGEISMFLWYGWGWESRTCIRL